MVLEKPTAARKPLPVKTSQTWQGFKYHGLDRSEKIHHACTASEKKKSFKRHFYCTSYQHNPHVNLQPLA